MFLIAEFFIYFRVVILEIVNKQELYEDICQKHKV